MRPGPKPWPQGSRQTRLARRTTPTAAGRDVSRRTTADAASDVGAGVGGPVAVGAAVPVEAERGRVIDEVPAGCGEDGLREVLYCLPRVEVGAAGDHGCDVDVAGVALQHAVGEEEQPVSRF